MSDQPYLTPALDARYHLQERRDGFMGLWGKVIYHGSEQQTPIDFIPYDYYPTGQSEGGPGIEMRVTLPQQSIPILQQMQPYHVHRWLASQTPPQNHLLAKTHGFIELWRVKHNQLSVVIVWGWSDENADWTIIPDCVDRLLAVMAVIQQTTDNEQ